MAVAQHTSALTEQKVDEWIAKVESTPMSEERALTLLALLDVLLVELENRS